MDGVEEAVQAHIQEGSSAAGFAYQIGTGFTKGWPGGNEGWFNFKGLIFLPTIQPVAWDLGKVQAAFAAGPDSQDAMLAEGGTSTIGQPITSGYDTAGLGVLAGSCVTTLGS